MPVDQGDRSVIPAPNSGREPTDAGDRGGWAQLVLFGIMAAGSAVIFGRVLWAGHQRSRLNQAHLKTTRRWPRPVLVHGRIEAIDSGLS